MYLSINTYTYIYVCLSIYIYVYIHVCVCVCVCVLFVYLCTLEPQLPDEVLRDVANAALDVRPRRRHDWTGCGRGGVSQK